MPNKCNKEPETCQLSYKGNACKLLNFELSPDNLAFEKCENIPKLIEKFVGCVGLDIYKSIASQAVAGDGDTAAGSFDYETASLLWNTVSTFVFCGLSYNIRLTLITTDGKVIFDSDKVTAASLALVDLHTTRMEFQAASETQWGAQRRYSKTVNENLQYYAFWLAGVNLSALYTPLRQFDGCDKRTQVVGVRLAVAVNSCANIVPQ